MLSAVAYAHERRLIHCDIKPENFILFDGDHLRLGDFGIAKISLRTIQGSGSGTVGHIAPEQAMGKPSSRSDVFSLGLIIYRMLTGYWPQFPFEWPLPGANLLRRKSIHPDMIAFIRRTLAVRPQHRFVDAIKMEKAFHELLPKTIRHLNKKKSAQGK
jgi:serine/threonine protein kinase